MKFFAKKKILKAIIYKKPFPHLIIKNFLPLYELNRLNLVLPSFNEIPEENVIFQSTSHTKKTIMPDSEIFKKLIKEKIFYKFYRLMKYLKPTIIKKFKNEIRNYVLKNFQKANIKCNMNFAIMKKGYVKSPHLDRRDHLISAIYYPMSEEDYGGNLQLLKNINKSKTFDVFPSKNSLILKKNYKIKKNFCIIFLNVPWAYHAVSKYYGKKDRKYFYVDYDFKLKKSSSLTINRKKGSNVNLFWINKVEIKSQGRRKNFFSE